MKSYSFPETIILGPLEIGELPRTEQFFDLLFKVRLAAGLILLQQISSPRNRFRTSFFKTVDARTISRNSAPVIATPSK